MAGETGTSRTKTAAFSGSMSDRAEGSHNQQQLGAFQKEFTSITEQLDGLEWVANKPSKVKHKLQVLKKLKGYVMNC